MSFGGLARQGRIERSKLLAGSGRLKSGMDWNLNENLIASLFGQPNQQVEHQRNAQSNGYSDVYNTHPRETQYMGPAYDEQSTTGGNKRHSNDQKDLRQENNSNGSSIGREAPVSGTKIDNCQSNFVQANFN